MPEPEQQDDSMVRAAIRIGARMGITLTQGDKEEATGNGLLEAVKGNVEHRDIFERKIEETITSLRESCENVGDKVLELLDARSYRIKGCSDEDWARGVQHHAEYFGDMMLVALAHFIGKNILVINTDSVSAPVRVVFGDRFCWHCPPTELDSEYPCHPRLQRDALREPGARHGPRRVDGQEYHSEVRHLGLHDGDRTLARILCQRGEVTRPHPPPPPPLQLQLREE